MVVPYRGYEIRVPEPEVFVLLKLLVIPRRRDPSKIEKDVYTARSLGDYLPGNTERRGRLRAMFSELPKEVATKDPRLCKITLPEPLGTDSNELNRPYHPEKPIRASQSILDETGPLFG